MRRPTLSRVLRTWSLASWKQSGRGPSSRQMLFSTLSRTASSKPSGWVACMEKYLQGAPKRNSGKCMMRTEGTGQGLARELTCHRAPWRLPGLACHRTGKRLSAVESCPSPASTAVEAWPPPVPYAKKTGIKWDRGLWFSQISPSASFYESSAMDWDWLWWHINEWLAWWTS